MAFGILVKRWGILWRSLEVVLRLLPNAKHAIGECVALHTACIDQGEDGSSGSNMHLPAGVNGWGSGHAQRPRT